MTTNEAPAASGPLEWKELFDTMRRRYDELPTRAYLAPVETTAEMYYNQLGCVPPAAQSGTGFLVGEWAFHHEGQGVAAAFWRDDRTGKYFASYMTLQQYARRRGGLT